MKAKYILIPLLSILLVSLYLSFIPKVIDFSFGNPATNDFAQYWSAFRILISGENPYQPERMLELQNTINNGKDASIAVMMWNPPWSVLILSPILIFDFPEAASLWLLCNLFFLFASSFLLKKIYKSKAGPSVLVVSSLIFIPAWECINWGQLSLFLLFSLTLFFYGICKDKNLITILGICGMSLKPQLFLVIGLVFIFKFIVNKNFKLILEGILSLGFLMLISEFFLSNATLLWLNASAAASNSPYIINIYEWMPATLMTWVRLITENQSAWLMWILTLVIMLGSFIFLLTKKPLIIWEEHFPLILSISFIAAPYSWLYDQSLFLIVQMSLIFLYLNKKIEITLTCGVFLIQILYLYLKMQPYTAQHSFAFFPLAWLLLTLLAARRLKTQRQ